MARGQSHTTMKAWVVGDTIQVGKLAECKLETEWVDGIVIKTFPLTVDYGDNQTEVLDFKTLRRRPPRTESDEPKVKQELPAEVLKEQYFKALVEIIHEGDTRTPNATVRRIVDIARKAIGEIT